MLWLAGLMGVSAVGAAVFMDFRIAGLSDEDHGEDNRESMAGKSSDQAADLHTSSGRDEVQLFPEACGDAPLSLITDFIPQDDSLLCIWDDSGVGNGPPALRVAQDPAVSGQLQVWLGDEVVAQVSGQHALDSADIALMPLSSAIALKLVSTQVQPAQ
ncbi:hypothetical protein AB2B41_09740 [Marimonas sp. MJW-29]|uniref:Uncharacterized protein n=1 Tax=Sulfitobacter sediminis TaxID=3234186 RepID=A0ABV3RLX2_9RHOB